MYEFSLFFSVEDGKYNKRVSNFNSTFSLIHLCEMLIKLFPHSYQKSLRKNIRQLMLASINNFNELDFLLNFYYKWKNIFYIRCKLVSFNFVILS